MDETELIAMLKDGDPRAFRLVVERYQASILNCCFRFVRSREIAEDLTQEVFIGVHHSINDFKSQSSLATWLYRIAITKSLDHLKSLKRKKRIGFLFSLDAEEEGEEITVPSSLPTPQQELENNERVQVLARAVETLPDNQKVAFTLSCYDALSYKEIAEILNTTIPAVESLLFRAKSNLKKKLYRYYKEQSG